ncbi:MAG: DUF4091 domain-containing protein [Fimbriimonadales bacterium]|nr:DUF4091 domain-containing protein [Fimbriimonadales bacterium]
MLFGPLCLGLAATAAHPQADLIRAWLVDPLRKVLRSAEPGEDEAERAEVARGENAQWQLVVRCSRPMTALKAFVSPLRRRGGQERLPVVRARFVGFVPIPRLADSPDSEALCGGPCELPDPLLADAKIDLPANQSQPVWLDVDVPQDAVPGLYEGYVRVLGQAAGRTVSARIAISAKVFEARVGASRLWVTNWFQPFNASWDDPSWPERERLERRNRMYARSMKAHRQNVVLVPVLRLTSVSRGPDGALRFDFSELAQFLRWFDEEGVLGRIEGGHLGGRVGGQWEAPFEFQHASVADDGTVAWRSSPPDDPNLKAFYRAFLPALKAFLVERGYWRRYLQHLADEPIAGNRESYRAMAALVKEILPDLKVIEACHDHELTGALDVWVPQLNFLRDQLEHYRTRQKAGEEVWFYTCVFPQGDWPNRFLEQPLIKTRLLHWVNFAFGATGYLHWGWNQFPEKPFEPSAEWVGKPLFLPAGDTHIVYPVPGGLLDSIRHEAMRDGIADYELLSLVAEKRPELARSVAERTAPRIDKVNTDVAAFRQARRELLVALGEIQKNGR